MLGCWIIIELRRLNIDWPSPRTSPRVLCCLCLVLSSLRPPTSLSLRPRLPLLASTPEHCSVSPGPSLTLPRPHLLLSHLQAGLNTVRSDPGHHDRLLTSTQTSALPQLRVRGAASWTDIAASQVRNIITRRERRFWREERCVECGVVLSGEDRDGGWEVGQRMGSSDLIT